MPLLGRHAGSGIGWGVVALIAVLLTGCTSGGEPDSGGGGDEGSRDPGPLANLKGGELCDFVDYSVIERVFGVGVVTQVGLDLDDGGAGIFVRETVECTYFLEKPNEEFDKFWLTVEVGVADGAANVDEATSNHFDDERRDYERVDGVGDGAGYARKLRYGGDQLFVILDRNDTLFEVAVGGNPVGTVEQLTPIAVEVLGGLDPTW